MKEKKEKVTPRELGYRMPAEWEAHEQCWMGWPERKDVWPHQAMGARKAVVDIVRELSKYERVTVLANAEHIQACEEALACCGKGVRVMEAQMDDIWLRDTGPTFLTRIDPTNNNSNNHRDCKQLAGVVWKFNGWGEKFFPWDRDVKVARRIVDIEMEKERVTACFDCRSDEGNNFVLEGGSFHTDGEGTLLVTESCLLNKNRNPRYTKHQIEEKLCDTLGVTKIIWLPSGLLCDSDTDGHVDNFACFAGVGVVLLAWCECECQEEEEGKGGDHHHHHHHHGHYQQEQHLVCSKAESILKEAKDARGRNLQVTRVPLPKPQFYTSQEADSIEGGARSVGERLAASYLNFYIANGAVIVPGFGLPGDDGRAREIIQKAFPERKVVQLQVGRQLALGGGNVHCITQQQPRLQ